MSDYARILPQKEFNVKFKDKINKIFNPFLALCFCLKSTAKFKQKHKG